MRFLNWLYIDFDSTKPFCSDFACFNKMFVSSYRLETDQLFNPFLSSKTKQYEGGNFVSFTIRRLPSPATLTKPVFFSKKNSEIAR